MELSLVAVVAVAVAEVSIGLGRMELAVTTPSCGNPVVAVVAAEQTPLTARLAGPLARSAAVAQVEALAVLSSL
jgi:hypothetical protein